MTREEAISHCRYYKGESECPFKSDRLSWFWDMERVYAKNNGVFVGESALYRRLGGKLYPGIPNPLLYIMFTSWAKYVYDISKSLHEFYEVVDYYLFVADDYYPQDKIPNYRPMSVSLT